VEFDVVIPGAFEYYVSYGAEEGIKRGESGWILIEPSLAIKGHILPSLDAIILQTVVPKWMGPLNKWSKQFQVIGNLNFNMIHFVPMQVRGVSNSPYSLYDQLDLAPDLFEGMNVVTKNERFEMLSNVLTSLENDCGLLSMTDVVWNHTACNSSWLRSHPECGYNLVNSPHLMPAYVLDDAILKFSGELRSLGLPNDIHSEDDLTRVLNAFREGPYQKLRLWEYFVLNVVQIQRNVMDLFSHHIPVVGDEVPDLRFKGMGKACLRDRALKLKEHGLKHGNDGERFSICIETEVAEAYLRTWFLERCGMYEKDLLAGNCEIKVTHTSIGKDQEHDVLVQKKQARPSCAPTLEDLAEELKTVLNEINLEFYKQYDDDVASIFSSLANTIRWQRISSDGPRLGVVTSETPLVWSYFTRGFQPDSKSKVKANEFQPEQVWANNGWIWNGNPLVDFASRNSRAYFRREVIVWGDCVKLRYGLGPQDSPWLWEYMTQYTHLMAKYFHAFRIDNCHSTPRHVAQYLLDQARKVRPNLYVVAELFTGSADVDRVFVAQLGINSLIREAMQAWDPKELSRIVHRYSGDPVGSFRPSSESATHCMSHPHVILDMIPSEPHALFMDCTHDNEPPAQKRTIADTLPNAALVMMTCSAMGSTLGYDWCIPHNLNIVSEKRRYPALEMDQGMHPMRKFLNFLQVKMSLDRLTEIFVHHEEPWIIIYRQHPVTHRGNVLVARTAFRQGNGAAPLSPVIFKRTQANLLIARSMHAIDSEAPHSDRYITGIPSKLVDETARVKIDVDGENTRVLVDPNSPPGTIFVFETWLTNTVALTKLHELETLDGTEKSGISKICAELTLSDIGVALFKSEREEQENGTGLYNVPGYGPLVYAGICGVTQVLRPIMQKNQLGHAMCNNLREGPWLMGYLVDRLKKHVEKGKSSSELLQLAEWLKDRFELVNTVPSYLVPKYFSVVLMTAEISLKSAAYTKMGRFIEKSPSFVRNLALTSLQMLGTVSSAGLHPKNCTASLAAGKKAD
jgi:glycogen debranching enzyme